MWWRRVAAEGEKYGAKVSESPHGGPQMKKVRKKSRKDLRKLRGLISSKSATEKAAAEKRV
jgi:hypothetical protein